MSEFEYDGDAPGTEGFLGRRSPFTQIGDWVLLSGASPRAVHLYCVLSMHLNASRGDRMVWPSRKSLAKIMGLTRPQSVDGPMRELVKLDAIEVIRRRREDGGNERSKYIIHETPPDDYEGLVSLSEFYGVKGKSAGSRVGAETAQGMGAETASGVGAETAQGDVRFTAHELEEVELEEVEPVLPTGVHSAHTPASAGAHTREDEPPAGSGGSPENALDHDPLLDDLPASVKKRSKKACRVPEPFEITDAMEAWAAETTPGVDLAWETDKFVDYWLAKSGSSATKLDWTRTWQNWIRSAFERLPRTANRPQAASPEHQRQAAEVAEWWWAQCRAAGVIHGESFADLAPLLLGFIADSENPVAQKPLAEALRTCREPVPPAWKIRKALRGELGIGPVVDAAGRPVSRQEQMTEAKNERSMERASLLTSYNERTGAKLTLLDLQVMKSRGQEVPEELKILLAPLSAQAAGPPTAPVLGTTVIQGEVSA
jgi:hypothetical protein